MVDFGGYWGFKGVWEGLGGSRRGLLYPCMTLFVLLEVMYGTRFGSKHYKMVQLANVC